MVRFQPAFLISIAASFWSSTNVFADDALEIVVSSTDWIYGDPNSSCQESCEYVDESDTCVSESGSGRDSIRSDQHIVYVASLFGVTCDAVQEATRSNAIFPAIFQDGTCYWNADAGVTDCETDHPWKAVDCGYNVFPFCCCGDNCPVVEPPTTSPIVEPPTTTTTTNTPATTTATTPATGTCYPTYVEDESYSSGNIVSAKTVTERTTTTSCAPAGVGSCPTNGFKDGTTTATETNNYKCVSNANSAYCGTAGYAPSGINGGIAWTKMEVCTGRAGSATVALPDLYNGNGADSGCPKAFVAGTDYDAADVVSVVRNSPGSTYTSVYQCAGEPTNQFCGMAGYEAGEGLYWSQAWTELGRCDGTISPTGSPSNEVLTNAGGCPREYESSGDNYEEGDRVSKDGYVYTCKGWPNSAHCSQAGYEPGNDVPTAEDPYWKQAWSVTGFCSGTIAPTSSPSNEVLTFMGGCPEVWDGSTYEEGDKVSDGQLVFQCKAWPHSGHCGQAGYEPNTDSATPGDAWKDAWTVVGYCSGSVGPTSSPSIDAANSVGVCPEEWESGDNLKYEEGDMVSATVSDVPLRKIAFKCKAWPYSGHCGQHAPTEELGGSLGWTIAGSCDGSIGPTSSPSFDKLKEVAGGCPTEYSKSYTDYEAGDLVSYKTSATPSRSLLYECKPFPNSGYCNQAGFEPTKQYSNMAWTLKGYCDGSMAPTPAPQPYDNSGGTCLYKVCLEDETCNKDDGIETTTTSANLPGIVSGSTACSCKSGDDPACTKGTYTVCLYVPVLPYGQLSQPYRFGDEVRIGATRFKCKNWPNGLWCNNDAYKPELEAGIWGDAWTKVSDCPASPATPTSSPVFSPTSTSAD